MSYRPANATGSFPAVVAATCVCFLGLWGTAAEPVAEPPVKAAADSDKAEIGGKESKAARRKASGTIAHLRITGEIADGVGQGGVLADLSPRLHRIVERLDKAADDKRVEGVLLTIESPAVGRARADELRAAIGRLRKAGKPVSAVFVGGSATAYAIASACDTVVMPPAALLELTGVRAEMMFFKAMLDRIGVDAEILQVGEFKGAGEPYTRSSMSPQLRKQYESFIGDLYEQLIKQVAADRGLEEQRVRKLVDTGVFTPEAAREAGLVDLVQYEDEALATLAKGLGSDSPKLVRDYAAQKMDDDFSGLGGLIKLVELFSGGKQVGLSGKGQTIAIVHVTGEIREGKSTDDPLMGTTAGSETLVKAIREAAADEQVAAIVLRIDSPGGSALASDLIWREAKRAKKPVVASLSDIAASGGYYIAVSADRIVAAPGTLTGSIGVVGGKMAIGGALGKAGVHTDVVSMGKNSGWLSVNTKFTADEREVFLGTMKDVYRLFTGKVAAGRKIDLAKVEALAEGRVYTGQQALEVGLVDRLGTLDDAIDEAKKLAKIAAEDDVQRMLLPKPRGLFDDLFAASGGDLAPVARLAGLPTGDAAVRAMLMARLAGLPGLTALATETETLVQLLSGRPQMLMPLRVRVR
jgi:protease IV